MKILSLDRCDESKIFSQWHDCTQTLSYSNGDKYEGYWLHGRKHGQGLYEYKTPLYYKGYKVQKFEGTWKSNSRDGLGIFHTTNNLKIEIAYTGGNLSELKWNPLEAGGIEPPSERTKPSVLHV